MTKEQQEQCRAEFEAYMGVPDVVLTRLGDSYLSDRTSREWKLWQAAYNSRDIQEEVSFEECLIGKLAVELCLPYQTISPKDATPSEKE